MRFLARIKPEFVLRLTLGIMYVYSGWDIFNHPKSWVSFVPQWLSKMLEAGGIAVETFLKVQAVGELAIAAVFIIWFAPKRLVRWAAFLSTVEMALILYFAGVDLITFRDIGVLGASAALWLIYIAK